MAAGKFFWTTTAMKFIGKGQVDLEGDKIWAALLQDSYSPSTASHSAYSDISAHIATASNTVVNSIQLTTTVLTGSGNHTMKWDADDISGFSSDGSTIASAKYLGVFHQTATAAAILLGFIDLNTAAGDASVGESTQVNVLWNAAGIAKLRSNQ